MTAAPIMDGIEVEVINGSIHLRYWCGGVLLGVALMDSEPARAIGQQLTRAANALDHGVAAGGPVH